MELSAAGLALTKSFEGLRLEAYQDSAGVWTIGYGHTGRDVRVGMVIDEAQAEALLLRDMADAVACVNRVVRVPLGQAQFDALVDFCYNAGQGSLERSTLLQQVNLHNFGGAEREFALWVHAGGEVVPGLVRRRKAEAEMFAG